MTYYIVQIRQKCWDAHEISQMLSTISDRAEVRVETKKRRGAHL